MNFQANLLPIIEAMEQSLRKEMFAGQVMMADKISSQELKLRWKVASLQKYEGLNC